MACGWECTGHPPGAAVTCGWGLHQSFLHSQILACRSQRSQLGASLWQACNRHSLFHHLGGVVRCRIQTWHEYVPASAGFRSRCAEMLVRCYCQHDISGASACTSMLVNKILYLGHEVSDNALTGHAVQHVYICTLTPVHTLHTSHTSRASRRWRTLTSTRRSRRSTSTCTSA